MIDAACGGALMDKTPEIARNLISNMAENSQQFTSKNSSTIRTTNEVYVSMVADNQRLENKLTKLTSLVRQLAIGQQQTVIAANQTRPCGICLASDNPTDTCPTLQETESTADVSVMQSGQRFRPQQQQYNPFSNTYNPGWRDHLNL